MQFDLFPVMVPALLEATQPVLTLLAPDLAKADVLARQEKSAATRRAYGADLRLFETWCAERAVSALPATAETVAGFMASEAERGSRASTISRRIAAIRYAHKLAGQGTPTDDERVKATLRGIRRNLGTAPEKKAQLYRRVLALSEKALGPEHPDFGARLATTSPNCTELWDAMTRRSRCTNAHSRSPRRRSGLSIPMQSVFARVYGSFSSN